MSPQSTQQVIAIPYYEALRQPSGGLARIFFIAHVRLPDGTLQELHMAVWNPKTEPVIHDWLIKLGVQGILCSDFDISADEVLNGGDVWVKGGLSGDVEAMLSQWLSSSVRHQRSLSNQASNSAEKRPTSIRLSKNYEGVPL